MGVSGLQTLGRFPSRVNLVLAALALALFFLAVLQQAQIIGLSSELSGKETQVSSLQREASLLKENLSVIQNDYSLLEEDFSALESNMSRLEEECAAIKAAYGNLKEETSGLIEEVQDYRQQIQDSMEWFSENALLGDSKKENDAKRKIDENCYEVKSSTCRIKLGCFYLVNSKKLHLSYISDVESSGEIDRLLSLQEFLANGGGDCEDYSLFYKAEYNYAVSRCEGKEVILEGWFVPEEGDLGGTYWLNFQKGWFLEGVSQIDFQDYIYPNIVCGNLYDPVLRSISGHCMIAFSSSPLESIGDLEELDGAYLIEPQDGSFFGNLNRENSGVYLLDEELWVDKRPKSWISTVITDKDFFLFDSKTLSWKSYSYFDGAFAEKEALLSGLN
ncbi:MAG: hypothetical protein JW727_06910 [Candidatus Aenigmarchaeota archaeon]|nr:hypothetical protein [Candidatus Aenigmarchaeota archaeon]